MVYRSEFIEGDPTNVQFRGWIIKQFTGLQMLPLTSMLGDGKGKVIKRHVIRFSSVFYRASRASGSLIDQVCVHMLPLHVSAPQINALSN